MDNALQSFSQGHIESVEQMAENMNRMLADQQQVRTDAPIPLFEAPSEQPIAYLDDAGQVWPHLQGATLIIGVPYLYTSAEVAAAIMKADAAPPIQVSPIITTTRHALEAAGYVKPVEPEPPKVGDRQRMLDVFAGRAEK